MCIFYVFCCEVLHRINGVDKRLERGFTRKIFFTQTCDKHISKFTVILPDKIFIQNGPNGQNFMQTFITFIIVLPKVQYVLQSLQFSMKNTVIQKKCYQHKIRPPCNHCVCLILYLK